MLEPGSLIQLAVIIASLSASAGAILSRIAVLEKKVEKHNCFMERLAVSEVSLRDMDRRLIDLERKEE